MIGQWKNKSVWTIVNSKEQENSMIFDGMMIFQVAYPRTTHVRVPI